MFKIKVYNGSTCVVKEVTDSLYKIIERIVIEKVTNTVEKQILLKSIGFNLSKIMDTYITLDIYEKAIKENTN